MLRTAAVEYSTKNKLREEPVQQFPGMLRAVSLPRDMEGGKYTAMHYTQWCTDV